MRRNFIDMRQALNVENRDRAGFLDFERSPKKVKRQVAPRNSVSAAIYYERCGGERENYERESKRGSREN